ncbi:mannose-1-phosphate guanyltransferase [Enterobacter hormaechei subsp. hoffmannii]|uniref:ABC transporter permease n=1 Tax=Enterobacter hormaechei TaxID=158836 RepID=UPI000642C890|nr:ABC transporter permease [Enterobacter hormaechei]KLR21056.1 mannose-1-phosphate guanyltransferase [Enterobacter hormaechei subsp. hoffmannii]
MFGFSLTRWYGIFVKELQELRRDELSAGMLIIIPLMQIIMFGYAINMDPRHLPAAVLDADKNIMSRSMLYALHNSGYFSFDTAITTEQAAAEALAQGKVQFVISFPSDFSHKLLRGEKSSMLIEADATDPAAIVQPLAAAQMLSERVLKQNLPQTLKPASSAITVEVVQHRMYNPEGITQYNIVPGLLGIILTMTLVLMAGLAIARESENGTMESLLATPATPLEVMIGKITPYVIIGMLQSVVICIMVVYLFNVPIQGDLFSLFISILLFIAASLAVGIALSVFAKNQLQSMQLTFFYFLPSVLLTGFMFPFRGMPEWAQYIGSCLPLTYFLRLIRGVILKGNTLVDMWADVWPLIGFTAGFMILGLFFYQRTLD